MITNQANGISNEYVAPVFQPQTVLPVNGVLPGSEDHQYFPHVRQAKLKAFKNERQAYDSGMWLRAVAGRESNRQDVVAERHCESRGLILSNTMSEGTGAAGGYLTPAPLSSAIIDVREQTGVARAVCDIQPMTSDTLTIPKRAGGLTVYAPGEGSAITTSDASRSQVELISKKRAVAAQISQELVDDGLINVVDNVISEMGTALALQEDNELINGTGAATTYFGVRGLLTRLGAGGTNTAVTGHSTFGTLDLADFAATAAKLPGRYAVYKPSWICSPEFYWAAMARLGFAAGGITMAEIMGATPAGRTFMGFPVHLTTQMPIATAVSQVSALFGAFSKAVVLGDRTGIRVGRSDDYAFLTDLVTLKATSRYDINVHDPGTASLAGAFVGLKTAAS